MTTEEERRKEIEWPIDLTPTQLQEPANRLELRAVSMNSWVHFRVVHNGTLVISEGVGATLGEALMVAGALMTGTAVVPIHKRILGRLLRRR